MVVVPEEMTPMLLVAEGKLTDTGLLGFSTKPPNSISTANLSLKPSFFNTLPHGLF